MITVYSYAGCGTCKKALRWFAEKGIDVEVQPIVEQPPSQTLLATVLRETGLPLARLFNTSGQLYRQGDYKTKLKTMTEDEALAELATHGKLVKRPVVVGKNAAGKKVYLVGFQAEAYEAALG